MSKRKNSDNNYEHLMEKIKKLEREVFSSRRKKLRTRRISSTSSSSPESPTPSTSRSTRRSKQRDRQEDVSVSRRERLNDSDDEFVSMLYGRKATPPAPTVTPVVQAGYAASSVSYEPMATNMPAPVGLESEGNALDSEILEILGVDPTQTDRYGAEIHKEVAIRFEHYATTGLTKEVRKTLTENYLLPSNCRLVGAPALNPEMKAALTEPVVKRDKAIELNQKLIASAISSLGKAITMVLSVNEKQPELLRLLIDTGRIICDCQHNNSQTRRHYVLSSLKNELREQMKATKIDNLLFGQDLQDAVKTAKAINKSGADLKAPKPFTKPRISTKSTPSTSKNWRNSVPNQKQPVVPRTKETTTPAAMKNPRGSSSRPSQRTRSNPR